MTTARNINHLPDPPPQDRLRGSVPSVTYPAGTTLFRSHGHGRGPWWFSNSGEGRFDLKGSRGTYYLAEDEVITLLETYGGLDVVPLYEAAKRDASELILQDPIVVADLTSNQAVQFRVTAEIFTTTDYSKTQRWAARLDEAGYGGLRYWARHDLVHVHACVALFDTAGDNGASARHGVNATSHLQDRRDLLDRLTSETGIAILDLP